MDGEARELVKEGKVTACYPENHTVRVEFEDKDGLISMPLPVLRSWAWQNKFYAMPDVGEVVVCLFASNADQTGTGWVIGSRYHDHSPPKVTSQDKARIDFKDGTFIEYDRAKHELRIKCVGKIFIDGTEIRLNEGD